MRGFRGYYRKTLVVVRLLYGCCKTGKQVSGYNHKERAHITTAVPARRQSCVQCPKFFFWGQLQRVLLVGHVGFRKNISWSGFVVEREISLMHKEGGGERGL